MQRSDKNHGVVKLWTRLGPQDGHRLKAWARLRGITTTDAMGEAVRLWCKAHAEGALAQGSDALRDEAARRGLV